MNFIAEIENDFILTIKVTSGCCFGFIFDAPCQWV